MKKTRQIPGLATDDPSGLGIVSVEHIPGPKADAVRIFRREGESLQSHDEPFTPFLWVESDALASGLAGGHARALVGDGALKTEIRFETWKQLDAAARALRKKTGKSAGDPAAPYFLINDPVQQYLMSTGRTYFQGMSFRSIRRLSLDIETATEEGYEFSNAEREGDRILAVGLADSTGWMETLTAEQGDEAELLRRAVATIAGRDPDVIEGHNLFGFDLPYLRARCRRHRVPFCIGREGREPAWRSGRFTAAERTQNYERAEVWGRSVVDTYFLVQLYDTSHRSLPGYGLKEVARHFGLAPEGRVYLEGAEITRVFRDNPERVLAYLRDDLRETSALSAHLLPVYVAQAQVLPYSLSSAVVRGNAAKIDALLLRTCLRDGAAIPRPAAPRPFEGGYTDIFFTGVARPVHHCDARSLYPSIMLAEHLGPASDASGVFLGILDTLRAFRLDAKDRMRAAADPDERARLDALQSTFKILINSFYGYLGFAQARFSDFDAAERVTARGREILRAMLDALRAQKAQPVEIDTDGIYYVPPETAVAGAKAAAFRAAVAAALPEGIEVEFDGEYEAMFSYKMKNYALLDHEGEITVKGAALKSRGLEPFLREYIGEWLELKLHGRDREISALTERMRSELLGRVWPVQKFARSERLQDSPASYRASLAGKNRGRSAAYELALVSGREYRAGDLLSYYVTGDRKNVTVHAFAKLVSQWNPERRDENVAYYLAKLEETAAKLGEVESGAAGEGASAPRPRPGELNFGS